MDKELYEQAKAKLIEYGIDIEIFEKDIVDYLVRYKQNFLCDVMKNVKEEKHFPKLKNLVENSAEEDLFYRGENVIMWAAVSALGYEKLLLLKECLGDFVKKHSRDKGHYSKTALHYVARSEEDNPKAVHLLVEWGGDVNATDDGHYTPLHETAAHDKAYLN